MKGSTRVSNEVPCTLNCQSGIFKKKNSKFPAHGISGCKYSLSCSILAGVKVITGRLF